MGATAYKNKFKTLITFYQLIDYDHCIILQEMILYQMLKFMIFE